MHISTGKRKSRRDFSLRQVDLLSFVFRSGFLLRVCHRLLRWIHQRSDRQSPSEERFPTASGSESNWWSRLAYRSQKELHNARRRDCSRRWIIYIMCFMTTARTFSVRFFSVLSRLNTFAFCECFQSGETLRADGVFHFAGVRFRNAFLDSEADQ